MSTQKEQGIISVIRTGQRLRYSPLDVADLVALPGSFQNPDFYDTSTPDIRVTACSMSSGLQTTLLTQPYPREAGAIQIAHTYPHPLRNHLASASTCALTWSQCISLASRLSNAHHK